jgi:hypothetical protein
MGRRHTTADSPLSGLPSLWWINVAADWRGAALRWRAGDCWEKRMRFMFSRPGWARVARLCGVAGCLWPGLGTAQVADYESWSAAFQTTYVWQGKHAFAAAYSGSNSLKTAAEKSYSFSATAFLGWRPWAGGELYANAEGVQGVPLSDLTGLGGFTNGEISRTSGDSLLVYRARLFLRQTWGQDAGQESVQAGPNQLAGSVDKHRWVLTVGNLSVLDVFDDNAYSHDPRTQFLNTALMTHGAYDYASDARGYSWGAALQWYHDAWTVSAGRFIQPAQPNQLALDPRWLAHYGDQVEIAHTHELGDQPGKLRLLLFRNRARMSLYADALTLAAVNGGPPDIGKVRIGDQFKYGLGLNLEQAVTTDLGLFARASWSDGRTETYAFAEIDRSASAGLLLKGAAWGRGQDSVGLAAMRNGLSAPQRAYLAAGGLGFFIGDGRLSYAPEAAVEMFYSLALAKSMWLTADWQHLRNPAYNADRGPVDVASLRWHAEF